MISWTNKAKSATTFISNAVRGKWRWSDTNALWSDSRFTWGGVGTVAWANFPKAAHSTTTTNNPFFGWLFLFTQSTTDTEGARWTNRPKN